MLALWEDNIDTVDTAEVHWSTSTILAIFFAATLVSAVFFGLGYSFGRGGSSKPGFSSANLSAAIPAGITNHSTLANLAAESHAQPKPVVAAPTQNSVAVKSATTAQGSAVAGSAMAGSAMPGFSHTASSRKIIAQTAAPIAAIAKSNSSAAVPVPAKTRSGVDTGAVGSAKYMVQVGAIGNRKDAERLVAQLRKHGLRAGIYPAKHDKFLHVQLGPFATVDQAQAARHHAIAGGFHAILKHAS